MGQFRVIAVRPLTGCDKKYLKILKENEFYLFYDDYKIIEDTIEKKTGKELQKSSVPHDFYKIADTNLNISISAIIGKNGDGKSSIIELIIRILNNFAYASGFLEKHDDLKPVKTLWAELYYEINGELISIVVNGDDILWELPNKPISLHNKEIKNIKKSYLEKYFFYTQVSNYSLYAYNSNEFKNESNIGNGDWITGIFHKNDGYQTPVVLNPMRTIGNIDINTENGLNKDRLISLFLTKNDKKEESFRWINDKQYAQYFEVKLKSGKSKLEENILQTYFLENQETVNKLTVDTILSPDTKLGTINNSEYCIQNIRNAYKRIRENRQVAPNIQLDLIDEFNANSILLENLFLISEKISRKDIEYYINISERILDENQITSNLKGTLSIYLTLLEDFSLLMTTPSEIELATEIKSKIKNIKQKFSIEIPTIEEIDPTPKEIRYFNLTHLYYIIIVALCNDIWREKLNDKILNSIDITNKLYDYIVYKTLSIANKYPNYEEYRTIFKEKDLLTDSKLVENLFSTLDSVADKIYKDVYGEKSHITLKIRQAINFFDHSSYYSNIDDKEKYIDITTFCNDIQDVVKKTFSPYSDERKTTGIHYNPFDYFFPPIFESDVILKQLDIENDFESSTLLINNGKFVNINVTQDPTLTNLSQLSSGERQQLNIVSAVIYHLRNINSVPNNEDNLVKYKHINLIFEEIELYFHPEYQRTFMNFLLYHLSKANLKLIKSINICFVTHSPFILSDIPQQNILALDKGRRMKVPFGTLGANIHEMLGHSFLLENTIGEIIKKKINSFIELYNDYCSHKMSDKNFNSSKFIRKQDDFEFLIGNLGEGYLKNILESYYFEMINPTELDELINQKRNELRKLEKHKRETK